jgi:DNA-binding LacI/PurR family transcriptional regulator
MPAVAADDAVKTCGSESWRRTVSPDRSDSQPAITAIRHPLERISAEMVRLLLAQIDGEPPAAVILPTELVVRESA